jgi:hypothetical protein
MGMVGGTDDHGVDLAAESIKHGAKIFKLRDVRELLVRIDGAVRIDVAKSHIIIGGQAERWFAAFAADANESEIDAAIGGRAAVTRPHDGWKSPSAGGAQGEAPQSFAARDRGWASAINLAVVTGHNERGKDERASTQSYNLPRLGASAQQRTGGNYRRSMNKLRNSTWPP